MKNCVGNVGILDSRLSDTWGTLHGTCLHVLWSILVVKRTEEAECSCWLCTQNCCVCWPFIFSLRSNPLAVRESRPPATGLMLSRCSRRSREQSSELQLFEVPRDPAFRKKIPFLFSRLKISFFLVFWGGVRLSPLGTPDTNWPSYTPRMTEDYGAFGGMRIGRGNRSTRRKLAPVPLCSPQIPHDVTFDRTRRLTARAQPKIEELEQ
jgi:hypothetical protein